MLMQGPGGPGCQLHSIPWPAGATACPDFEKGGKTLAPATPPPMSLPPLWAGQPCNTRVGRRDHLRHLLSSYSGMYKAREEGKARGPCYCDVVWWGVVWCDAVVWYVLARRQILRRFALQHDMVQ